MKSGGCVPGAQVVVSEEWMLCAGCVGGGE